MKLLMTLLLLFGFCHATVSFTTKTWMADASRYQDSSGNYPFQAKHINEITLPGSHDSATARLTSYIFDKSMKKYVDSKWIPGFMRKTAKEVIKGWARAQSGSIRNQLEAGIRVLDIRPAWDPTRNALCAQHSAAGELLTDVFDDIFDFFSESPDEIVVMYFSNWSYLDNKNEELRSLLYSKLGEKIYDFSSARMPTVGELQKSGRTLILSCAGDDLGSWCRKSDKGDNYADTTNFKDLKKYTVKRQQEWATRQFSFEGDNMSDFFQASWMFTPDTMSIVSGLVAGGVPLSVDGKVPNNLLSLADIVNKPMMSFIAKLLDQVQNGQNRGLGIFFFDNVNNVNMAQLLGIFYPEYFGQSNLCACTGKGREIKCTKDVENQPGNGEGRSCAGDEECYSDQLAPWGQWGLICRKIISINVGPSPNGKNSKRRDYPAQSGLSYCPKYVNHNIFTNDDHLASDFFETQVQKSGYKIEVTRKNPDGKGGWGMGLKFNCYAGEEPEHLNCNCRGGNVMVCGLSWRVCGLSEFCYNNGESFKWNEFDNACKNYVEVHVGTLAEGSNTKTVDLTADQKAQIKSCPSLVNKHVWLNKNHDFSDSFHVELDNGKVHVTRTNGSGWGVDLKIPCFTN